MKDPVLEELALEEKLAATKGRVLKMSYLTVRVCACVCVCARTRALPSFQTGKMRVKLETGTGNLLTKAALPPAPGLGLAFGGGDKTRPLALPVFLCSFILFFCDDPASFSFSSRQPSVLNPSCILKPKDLRFLSLLSSQNSLLSTHPHCEFQAGQCSSSRGSDCY